MDKEKFANLKKVQHLKDLMNNSTNIDDSIGMIDLLERDGILYRHLCS